MFIPLIMILMIFGMTPFSAHSQEAPPKAMTEEEIMASPEYKDLMQAQEAIGNFTGDENSQEFKTLMDDWQKKQDAFSKIIPASEENPAPASEQDTALAPEKTEQPAEETNSAPTEDKQESMPAENEPTEEQKTAPEQDVEPKPETPPA